MDKNVAQRVADTILNRFITKMSQDYCGDNMEILDRLLRAFSQKISRKVWVTSQRWSKWTKDGPVLFPNHTRIYYRKGNTEVVLQEFQPQIRILKFKGTLARSHKRAPIDSDVASSVKHYSVALPYVIFLYRFIDGRFKDVRCAFSDRPLKTLDEPVLRPYLSNIDDSLRVCLGSDFDSSKLIASDIFQQCAYIASYFWQSVFSDEWSDNYWTTQEHLSGDLRIRNLDSWQEASGEDPLFVIQNVAWLHYSGSTNFGNLIHTVMEGDICDMEFNDALFERLTNDFLTEIQNYLKENFDILSKRMVERELDPTVKLLLENSNVSNL